MGRANAFEKRISRSAFAERRVGKGKLHLLRLDASLGADPGPPAMEG